MPFEAWPDLRAVCPICGCTGCAIYRGYYSRFLFCTELEFTGRLVIRTGFCKTKNIRFSLIPDFILYRRRISRLTNDRLREARGARATLMAAVDDLIADLGEEFFLPLSTAHAYLRLGFAQPP